MSKKIVTAILSSIFLFFLICYLVFFLKTHFEHHDKISYLFKSTENLNFHKNYSKKLHHLRTSGFWGYKGATKNYLFTTINKFYPNKNNILFQGDSWVEQLVAYTSTNTYKKTYNLINNFAKKNDFGLINAGITSYSPSLMQVQYEVLEKDFDIKPNILVAYIDQTDIGDEICRYKDKRVFDKNNNLIAVKNESYSAASFDYTTVYNISEIKLLNKSQLKRTFKLTNFFLKYKTLTALRKFKYILKFGYKNRNAYRCKFGQIQKYLLKSNSNEISYFENRVRDYIDLLTSKQYIQKIILITFPHYGHTSGIKISENEKIYYTVNVSNIVEKAIKKEKKIHHLNFTKLIADNKLIVTEDMILENDIGSHLKDEYLANIFAQEIINLIIDK